MAAEAAVRIVEMAMKIELSFGALSPRISEQLAAQGFVLTKDDERLQQKLADAAVLLGIHGVLTESERDRVYRRIILRVIKRVRPVKSAAKSGDR